MRFIFSLSVSLLRPAFSISMHNLVFNGDFDVSVMSLNKLNVTASSSTKNVVMLTQCWFIVGQSSDMPAQH